ncbi:Cu(I)-responsive transcriptional regulator [Enterovirga rhinocerotis]|uniref:Cu(I)-responsive transcriptional regulator n=1 Tax=Enterovirga rhinocerotis TaxID=1339210 RepID=A0A4R7C7F8_9HYPH|nr:Cu(I)-responsive transcriptional regulator [Enterovirga rhinocerotis]TDR93185.1 Cu(I)-responsive transcriptional regulator [Enterovirga rhinocerotis]
MQIGEASAASGVSAKMIRHYEEIGLVPRAGRRDNSYRDYDAADVHRLRFIRRARDLGFSMDQIRMLLRLWSDQGRSNAEVKAIALDHVRELEDKIAQLRDMADTLTHLAEACDGSGRPHCPILRGLEGDPSPPACRHSSGGLAA